ncbi:MAG: alpha/beta hydrolase [Planctomycetota bacterium]
MNQPADSISKLDLRWASLCAVIALIAICLSGCAAVEQRILRQAVIVSIGNEQIVEVTPRKQRRVSSWNRVWLKPEPPSQRTAILLRRFNLEKVYQKRPDEVIEWLHQLVRGRPELHEVHALAELAEKQASWSYRTGDTQRATRLYAMATIHAYKFLFDNDLNLDRNAYDPQFRSICDIYNRSLEGMLREICLQQGFAQGYQTVVGEDGRELEIEVRIEGRWEDQQFERFELVNDFDTAGFENQYRTYGLGAPLIAIRKQQPIHYPSEQYYPPELTLPMTAFLHLIPSDEHRDQPDAADTEHPHRAILTLYDPLERTAIETEKNKVVPLESDITTPLAYGLRDPLINKGVIATGSLLNADFAPEAYGMFMLEPYDPEKIPVVMVHGLWSHPATWSHMFNDLRANPEIHNNYQFWFYSYPTGQPFWISAKQLREDLASIRKELDPSFSSKTLDEMIFVGHSMGGLISTMQVVESEDHFWSVVSHDSITKFEGDPETLQQVRNTFFFEANRSIDRVITISTPYRGSSVANSATRWLGQKLIKLPALVTDDFKRIARKNSDRINDPSFLTTTTVVDSLSPDSQVFDALAKSKRHDELTVHNIIGRVDRSSIFSGTSTAGVSDGVVEIGSAKAVDAQSQIFVNEEHQKVHQHPACILEVRRILMKNLAQQDRIHARPLPVLISSNDVD